MKPSAAAPIFDKSESHTPVAPTPRLVSDGEAHANGYWLGGWKLWALSFGLWTLLALFNAAGSCMYFSVAQRTLPSWKGPLLWSFTDGYTWALLTPFIYELCRRFSFTIRTWYRAVLFHVPAGILFACLGALLTSIVNLVLPWSRGHFDAPFRVEVIALFLTNVTRYSLIVAVMQAASYYGKFRESEVQSSQLESQLARAQLHALKMQLEPHFIFNVLNSIASLSRSDPAASEKMTLQLADLLRISLRSSHVQEVPLRRELDFLEAYLRIQQTRFRDRLSVRFQVEPAALDAAVPHLILQPLVENAIRHGISSRIDAGRIEVWARQRGPWLALQISDDGAGLPSGHRERLSGGVGLRNTRARLRQLYGDNYEFLCENAPDGGCRVKLAVPYRSLSPAGGGGERVPAYANLG